MISAVFQRMASSGIAVHTFDAQGHGRSDPVAPKERAFISQYSNLVCVRTTPACVCLMPIMCNVCTQLCTRRRTCVQFCVVLVFFIRGTTHVGITHPPHLCPCPCHTMLACDNTDTAETQSFGDIHATRMHEYHATRMHEYHSNRMHA